MQGAIFHVLWYCIIDSDNGCKVIKHKLSLQSSAIWYPWVSSIWGDTHKLNDEANPAVASVLHTMYFSRQVFMNQNLKMRFTVNKWLWIKKDWQQSIGRICMMQSRQILTRILYHPTCPPSKRYRLQLAAAIYEKNHSCASISYAPDGVIRWFLWWIV